MKTQWKIMACVTLLVLQGCAGPVKSYHPLPQNLENEVRVPGFRKEIRAFGDTNSQALQTNALLSLQQEMAQNDGHLQPVSYMLALSGGGADGAFGAGLLCGWTKSGTRPEFKLVTGISTGALMAPFAFLGSAYDERLKASYTTISDKDIYQQYGLFTILLALLNVSPEESVANNKPLVDMVAHMIDQKILDRIAVEYRKGRRLLIGTTQFNAERLVIWNMGAIAASGSPHALALFRKIMVASASLPVSFPPQYFKVEAGGRAFEEMHVDGGIETQVMLFENALIPFSRISPKDRPEFIANRQRERKLYVIRNQKIQPEWLNVKPEIKSIAMHAIDSLTKSQGIGDLFQIYTFTQSNGTEFNLAYIGKNFTLVAKTPFDNHYMRKLFAYGYALGKTGYAWQKYPPEFTPD